MLQHRLAGLTAVVAISLATAACGSDSTTSSTPSGGGGAVAGGSAVSIANFAFSPLTLSVKVGTTVTWSNKDGSTHTATADDGSFDTGNIAGGASGSATLAKAGTIKYHCNIHQYMTATITVTA